MKPFASPVKQENQPLRNRVLLSHALLIFPTTSVRKGSEMAAKQNTADYRIADYRKTNVVETLIYQLNLHFLITWIA